MKKNLFLNLAHTVPDGAGLIAHYKFRAGFNGTDTTFDYSLNGHSGAVTNAIPAYPGFDFLGTGYVTIADHADFSFGNATVDSPLSISAWIFVTSQTTNQIIISKYDDTTGSEDREWRLRLDTTEKLDFRIFDESQNVAATRVSNGVLANGWRFVYVTYTGQSTAGSTAANLIKLYVDGAVVASTVSNNANYDAMEAGSTDVLISAAIAVGGSESTFFKDKIGDVMIYDIEKTAADVRDSYELTRWRYGV